MRYYAQYNDNGTLLAIGTGYGGAEITEEEYNALMAEIRAKADLVNQLYNGEITLADIPTEWQEEIQRRVDERKQWEAENEINSDSDEATEEDYINALTEVGVI